MKKLILALTVVLFAGSVFAQSGLKPAIKTSKSTFKQDGKTSTTLFTLSANSTEIEDLKSKAANIPNIKLTADKQKGNTYSCKIVVTDRSESTYVQRIFGALGFSQFTLDGVEKPLTELGNELTKLK